LAGSKRAQFYGFFCPRNRSGCDFLFAGVDTPPASLFTDTPPASPRWTPPEPPTLPPWAPPTGPHQNTPRPTSSSQPTAGPQYPLDPVHNSPTSLHASGSNPDQPPTTLFSSESDHGSSDFPMCSSISSPPSIWFATVYTMFVADVVSALCLRNFESGGLVGNLSPLSGELSFEIAYTC
jgi:hypothetical protein